MTARWTRRNTIVQLDKMPTGRYGYQGVLYQFDLLMTQKSGVNTFFAFHRNAAVPE